jgi:hypothetical protein
LTAFLRARTAPARLNARDHPGLSSMGGGSVCPRLFAPADDRNAPATPSAGGAIQSQPASSISLASPETERRASLRNESEGRLGLALQCSQRARNSSPSVRKLTSVTICHELSNADQTIMSERVGTDPRLKNRTTGRISIPVQHGGWVSVLRTVFV